MLEEGEGYDGGGILHSSCVRNKTLFKHESCGETKGDCAVSQFDEIHNTRVDAGSPPPANRDAD